MLALARLRSVVDWLCDDTARQGTAACSGSRGEPDSLRGRRRAPVRSGPTAPTGGFVRRGSRGSTGRHRRGRARPLPRRPRTGPLQGLAGRRHLFGVLLLLLAVRTALRPAPGTSHRHRRRAVTRPGACALLGAGLMAVNFSSLALFVPAVKEIALAASVSTTDQAVVLAITVVLALLPVLVPLVLYLMVPAQAQSVLTPLLTAAKRHSRAIGVVICLVFGVYLTVKGAVRLS
ncbi:GAP family protein [Streptomyces sp. NPDC050416]|uniref:GAP family protein n=1 Tax=Streptomyces sp. NPDC050416 TaxID=3365611 RepID=UPI0037ABC263